MKTILVCSLALFLLVSCAPTNPAILPPALQTLTSNATLAADLSNSQEQIPTSFPTPLIIETPTALPVEIPYQFPLSIAFIDPDKNAFAWRETFSSPVQLTTTGDVNESVISTNGARVALLRAEGYFRPYTLDIVNSDGTNMRTLVDAAGFEALPRPAESTDYYINHISWVGDTGFLAMIMQPDYGYGGLDKEGETLYLIDIKDSSMRSLTINYREAGWDYSYSPDFTKIAVSSGRGIDIYDADGNLLVEKALEFPPVSTYSEYAWYPSPIWAADSSHLVVVILPGDPLGSPLDETTVWRVFVDGRRSELLFETPMGLWSVSPDLSRIIFSEPQTGFEEDQQNILYLSNIDGTGIEEITVGESYCGLSWALDSSKFYYCDREKGAFVGQPGSSPIPIPDFNQVCNVWWVDTNRFIGASGTPGSPGWKLLIGGMDSPTVQIFSTPNTYDYYSSIPITVNR